ncbi:hypothetical protein F66182_1849 [Fusarium sp. NRRL 66182]|nr:hypothetical protein F66182_1849 [Fusarium sp. NRRL 66182]
MADPTHLFGRDDSWIIVAPGPENITSPSLTANLFCRVILAILANLACLVPLKNLYHTGEFAAVIFILNIEWANLETITNALIWRNDDTGSWWSGEGLCDVNPYTQNFSNALFGTCLLAIMRNLAQQVGLLRVNPLTVREKRRRNLVQSFIMFPLPIIQLCWTWPLTTQRYAVVSLTGFLTYMRFREIARTTRSAINSNRAAHQRAQRTKRRLYLMVLSILIPFLPIVVTFAVLNVLTALPLQPFDYNLIHNKIVPYPWSAILFIPSTSVTFAYLNNCYIDILSSIPVVIFFGMTNDAINAYRRGLVCIGLGFVFPKLREEYDPDRYGTNSSNSQNVDSTISTVSSIPSKLRSLLSARTLNTASTTNLDPIPLQAIVIAPTTPEVESGRQVGGIQSAHPPQQELRYPDHTISPTTTDLDILPPRNPFLFRTRLDLPTILLPSLSYFGFRRMKDKRIPLESLPSVAENHLWENNLPVQSPRNQTHVWSDGQEAPPQEITTSESRLLVPMSSTYSVTTEPLHETYRR